MAGSPSAFTVAAIAAPDPDALMGVVQECIKAIQRTNHHIQNSIDGLVNQLQNNSKLFVSTLHRAQELSSSNLPAIPVVVEASTSAGPTSAGVYHTYKKTLEDMSSHLLQIQEKLMAAGEDTVSSKDIEDFSSFRSLVKSLEDEIIDQWSSLICTLNHAQEVVSNLHTADPSSYEGYRLGYIDTKQSKPSAPFSHTQKGLIEKRILSFLHGYEQNGVHVYREISKMGLKEIHIHFDHIQQFDPHLAKLIRMFFTRLQDRLVQAASLFFEDLGIALETPPRVKVCDVPGPKDFMPLTEFWGTPETCPAQEATISCGEVPLKITKTTPPGRIAFANLVIKLFHTMAEGNCYGGDWDLSHVMINADYEIEIYRPFCRRFKKRGIIKDFKRCATEIIPKFKCNGQLPCFFVQLDTTMKSYLAEAPDITIAYLRRFFYLVAGSLGLRAPLVRSNFYDLVHEISETVGRSGQNLLMHILGKPPAGGGGEWRKFLFQPDVNPIIDHVYQHNKKKMQQNEAKNASKAQAPSKPPKGTHLDVRFISATAKAVYKLHAELEAKWAALAEDAKEGSEGKRNAGNDGKDASQEDASAYVIDVMEAVVPEPEVEAAEDAQGTAVLLEDAYMEDSHMHEAHDEAKNSIIGKHEEQGMHQRDVLILTESGQAEQGAHQEQPDGASQVQHVENELEDAHMNQDGHAERKRKRSSGEAETMIKAEHEVQGGQMVSGAQDAPWKNTLMGGLKCSRHVRQHGTQGSRNKKGEQCIKLLSEVDLVVCQYMWILAEVYHELVLFDSYDDDLPFTKADYDRLKLMLDEVLDGYYAPESSKSKTICFTRELESIVLWLNAGTDSEEGLQILEDFFSREEYAMGPDISDYDMKAFKLFSSPPPSTYKNLFKWYNSTRLYCLAREDNANGAGRTMGIAHQEEVNAKVVDNLELLEKEELEGDLDKIFRSYLNEVTRQHLGKNQELDESKNEELVLYGRGLKSNDGEHNCFLNVIVQSLWHVKYFQDEVFKKSKHNHVDSCVVCSLHDIFINLSKEISSTREAKGESVSSSPLSIPSPFRIALSEAYAKSRLFQEEQMEDASEALDAILQCLHKSHPQHPNHAGACACMAHNTFGMNIYQVATCQNCKVEYKQSNIIFCQHINVRALIIQKGGYEDLSFDKLLREAMLFEDVIPCDDCDFLNRTTYISLGSSPQVFSVVLEWLVPESQQDSDEVVESLNEVVESLNYISSKIDLSLIYDGIDEETYYNLKSMVCYHDMRYSCFATKSGGWVKYSGQLVEHVGSLDDVIRHCTTKLLRPQMLFFEAC